MKGLQKTVNKVIRDQVEIACHDKARRDRTTILRYQDNMASASHELADSNHTLNSHNKRAELANAFRDGELVDKISEGMERGIGPTFNENLKQIIINQNRVIDIVNTTEERINALISDAKKLEQQHINLSKKVLSTIDDNGLQKQDIDSN